MKKQYYYLINNRVMKGGGMPTFQTIPKFTLLDEEIIEWKTSLQPCSITESELCLILSNVIKLDYDNPIEVTDIITDNNGVITFKQQEETNEALECNDDNMDSFINKYIRELPKNWRGEVDLYLGMKNAMLEALSYPDKYTITRNI